MLLIPSAGWLVISPRRRKNMLLLPSAELKHGAVVHVLGRGKHTLFQKVGGSCWKPVVLWWAARLPFEFLRQTFCFRFFSRTTVPLELRRQWTFWPNYTDVNPASTTICVDGEIGTVLKTYREVKTCNLQNDFSRKLILTSKGPYFLIFGRTELKCTRVLR